MRGKSYPIEILLAFYEVAKTTPKPSLKVRQNLIFQIYRITPPALGATEIERNSYNNTLKNVKIWFDNLTTRGIPAKLMKELQDRGETIPEQFLKIKDKKNKTIYRPYDKLATRRHSHNSYQQAGPPYVHDVPRPQTAPVAFLDYPDHKIATGNQYQPIMGAYSAPHYISPMQDYDSGCLLPHSGPDKAYQQSPQYHPHQHQSHLLSDDEVLVRVVMQIKNDLYNLTFADARIKKSQMIGNNVFELCLAPLQKLLSTQVPSIVQPMTMPVNNQLIEQHPAQETALVQPMAQDYPSPSTSAPVISTSNEDPLNGEIDFGLIDEFLVQQMACLE